MATLIEIYNLSQSDSIKGRVYAAIAKAARDIENEDPGTTNHAERLLWAKDTRSDIDKWVDTMMWDVVSNSTIQTAGETCTDNDLQFVINSNIDAYALNL